MVRKMPEIVSLVPKPPLEIPPELSELIKNSWALFQNCHRVEIESSFTNADEVVTITIKIEDASAASDIG
jgi:hypothetical protein